MTDSQFFDGPPTALEVRRYEFDAALRGYDRGQVDAFRDVLADELERLALVLQARDEELRLLRQRLEALTARDGGDDGEPRRGPVDPQRGGDALGEAAQVLRDAHREAQLVVREAREEADRQLDALRAERLRIQSDVHALWHARRSELARLRHALERQLVEISIAESEPMPNVLTGSTGGSA